MRLWHPEASGASGPRPPIAVLDPCSLTIPAAEANRKLVDLNTVHLEFDVEQLDKSGQILAYVYLEDGTFVNAWLVENGYAQVVTVPPNVKHEELLLKLQREARDAQRGLWGI